MPGLRSITDSAWLGSYLRSSRSAVPEAFSTIKNGARGGTCAAFSASRRNFRRCGQVHRSFAPLRMTTSWVIQWSMRRNIGSEIITILLYVRHW